MATCEFNETCAFFTNKLEIMPPDAEELKQKYCVSNNLNCARYIVISSIGAEKIPQNLYPSEKDRAYEAIAKA